MKKVTSLLIGLFFLTGCAETLALLGPASSIAGGGNVVQSSITSVIDYGVKKKTGKGSMEHALAYAAEKNPNKKKSRCISFIKETDSEACFILKKNISSAKKKTSAKIADISRPLKPKLEEKTKVGKNSFPQVVSKKETQVKKTKSIMQVKIKDGPQLKSVESILLETAMNKRHISHLRVSINKRSKTKDLSK